VEQRHAQPCARTIAVVGVGRMGADIAGDRTTGVVEAHAVGTGMTGLGVVAGSSMREDLRNEFI
jgi:hypothetical protein